jgi:hypothetical protein
MMMNELAFVQMGLRLGRVGDEELLRRLAESLPAPRYRRMFREELARREALDA